MVVSRTRRTHKPLKTPTRFGGFADDEGDRWLEEQRKKSGLKNDEGQFNVGADVVVKLEKKAYDWESKYRPRKPRYDDVGTVQELLQQVLQAFVFVPRKPRPVIQAGVFVEQVQFSSCVL